MMNPYLRDGCKAAVLLIFIMGASISLHTDDSRTGGGARGRAGGRAEGA
eukprot:SAG31_NODE_659_length_13095_cov_4.439597_1_plen_48_part_10